MPPERNEQNRLMDAAASGNDDAFGALALACQDRLFRFALAHGLGNADAAEATQETLLRAYQGRSNWRVGSNAMSWLYGIAMNVVRERWRSRARQKSAAIDVESLQISADEGAPEDQDARERLGLLSEAIGFLPPRQREAVACRYLRQMSVHETALVMGCAEGTVKAAVFAALANLRKTMAKY